jgi:hypothetical protein
VNNLAHEIIIAAQSRLGKIARNPHTPEQLKKAAETAFIQLSKLRFKIG